MPTTPPRRQSRAASSPRAEEAALHASQLQELLRRHEQLKAALEAATEAKSEAERRAQEADARASAAEAAAAEVEEQMQEQRAVVLRQTRSEASARREAASLAARRQFLEEEQASALARQRSEAAAAMTRAEQTFAEALTAAAAERVVAESSALARGQMASWRLSCAAAHISPSVGCNPRRHAPGGSLGRLEACGGAVSPPQRPSELPAPSVCRTCRRPQA